MYNALHPRDDIGCTCEENKEEEELLVIKVLVV